MSYVADGSELWVHGFNAMICVSAEGVELPTTAVVKLSIDPHLEAESSVSLDQIELDPGSAVLLQFPYTG